MEDDGGGIIFAGMVSRRKILGIGPHSSFQFFDTVFWKYLFLIERRENTSWIKKEECIWPRTQGFFFRGIDAPKAGGDMSAR